MSVLPDLPVFGLILAFLGLALVIAVAGTGLTSRADEIADRTGMGEAIAGGLFLGATTSLPGSLLSAISAYQGYAELAISNAIGGIVAQSAFLAIADTAYRRANLEHAAASLTNLAQGALLVTCLSLPLVAMSAPPWTILGTNPMSLVLICVYIAGLRITSRMRDDPMWRPERTQDTQLDTDEPTTSDRSGVRLGLEFFLLAVIAALAGIALSQVAVGLSAKTGLTQTAVGGVFTAVTTSLPELVTSVAAVRRGALTLAVGGIIGGNAYDVLFLSFSDVAYQAGSIYHAFNQQNVFVVSTAIAMTGILLLGLLRRERFGPVNIGLESVLILVMYAASVVVVLL